MNDKREVKTNFFDKVIRGIEVMGNKLPNPFLLFMMAWGVILILSQVLSGISAVDPATGEKVMIVGMLNPEGLTWVLKNMVGNYIKFSPMGTVLVMMIGLGVATSSGLLNEQWLVFLVVFVWICGNIASGAASAIVPALAASLFFAAKKDPIFGLCIGFAGVTAGYTANIILTGTDVLLSGVSTTAYQLVIPDGVVEPTCNYYFMIASTVIISAVASFVINRFMTWGGAGGSGQRPQECPDSNRALLGCALFDDTGPCGIGNRSSDDVLFYSGRSGLRNHGKEHYKCK